jgi:hypothetical protein
LNIDFETILPLGIEGWPITGSVSMLLQPCRRLYKIMKKGRQAAKSIDILASEKRLSLIYRHSDILWAPIIVSSY